MSGVISIGIQIFILPVLLRRFSPARIYMTCMKMWPLAFICMPLLNVIARTGVDAATGKMLHTTAPLTWMGIIGLILWTRIACIAYSYASVNCARPSGAAGQHAHAPPQCEHDPGPG
jgi:hypothetical protein